MALSALKIPAALPLVSSSGALERKKRLNVAPFGRLDLLSSSLFLFFCFHYFPAFQNFAFFS
jgi:hypothetical protein